MISPISSSALFTSISSSKSDGSVFGVTGLDGFDFCKVFFIFSIDFFISFRRFGFSWFCFSSAGSVLISFLTEVDSGEGGDLERGLRSNLDGLDLERGLVVDLDLEVEGLGLDLDLDRGLSGDFESFEDFEL